MMVVQPSIVSVDQVKNVKVQDFSGGPVVKTSPSNAEGADSYPWSGS